MLRQIAIIISLSMLSQAALAATESTSEGETKVYSSSPLQFGLDLQYYAPAYKNYVYGVDDYTGENQTSAKIGQGAQVGLEWLPFGNKIGKLGIGVSSGFVAVTDTTVQRTDVTVDPNTNAVTTSKNYRQVNLYVVPSSAFLSYHFDYFQNQLIVPYAKIGASANWIRQTVDGNESYSMFYGYEYAIGGEFCLNAIEPKAGREFDSRFGVNGTYLMLEYVKSDKLNKSNPVNLAYDAFRFGMRFEF